MAVVINKATKKIIRSAHTPDYPPGLWIINPDLSNVEGVDPKYWKIVGNAVLEMNQVEKDAVDAAEQPTVDEQITSLYDSAVAFGNKLMGDFVKENIKLGITQLGLTNHVKKTLADALDSVLTGSLYDAIYEVSIINPADLDVDILTAARLLSLRNQVEEFLGVDPLSTAYDDPFVPPGP